MNMQKVVVLVGLASLFLGCGASQNVYEPNAALDEMMAQKAFEIKVRTAEPMVTQAMGQIANSGMLPPGNTVSRIDVTGTGYYIKVKGDSVSADLPYYGERQMGGGYDSDAGIKFEGIAKDIAITKDDTKQSYEVKFSISSNAENYLLTVSAGNNQKSITSIRSSHRNRIRYTGDIKELKE